jgi:hypothetical protein
MSLAHPYPTLRSRIDAASSRSGTTTIRAGVSGVRPHDSRSFSERYRGTEFASPVRPEAMTPEPFISKGRAFVLVSAAAVMTILAATVLMPTPG